MNTYKKHGGGTHKSKTDAEARLYKKSSAGEARPSYLGHLVMENRNRRIGQPCVTLAGRREESEAALAMLQKVVAKGKAKRGGSPPQEITVGADKAYQVKGCIEGLRQLGVVPHVAEYARSVPQWPNCLTASARNHFGFAISQANRKRVEKSFGWIKVIAGLRKTKFRGRRRVEWMFSLAATALNLMRMAKLMPRAA
jgi:DDE family transposase